MILLSEPGVKIESFRYPSEWPPTALEPPKPRKSWLEKGNCQDPNRCTGAQPIQTMVAGTSCEFRKHFIWAMEDQSVPGGPIFHTTGCTAGEFFSSGLYIGKWMGNLG
jgi:hypothetical protein